jgi:hypothetical protein
VFLEKRLQTIENKGSECGKWRKEEKKRRQAVGNKRVEKENRTGSSAAREIWMLSKNYRATQIGVKIKERLAGCTAGG